MAHTPDALDYLPELTRQRRALHRMPERGFQEHRTQRFVLDELRAMGVDARPMAGTGVHAVIRGELPGPCTAFRADMDALCVQECTGVDFASDTPGMMHACGHDGHMATLLAAASAFARHRDRLRGTAVLLFQPCEENVRGAASMIEAGALEDPPVDRIFALHVMPHIPQGTVGVVDGPVMSGACEFQARFTGKSAHGAMPQLGADAIVAAAAFVGAAQTVVSRTVAPQQPALVTIGRLEGGVRHNVIAESAFLEGTARCYDEATLAAMTDRLQAQLRGVGEAHGVQTQWFVADQVPPTVNAPALAAEALAAWPEGCARVQQLMVAEDFGRYAQQVPGFMGLLGCRNEQRGFVHSLHSGSFNFDETALVAGLKFYLKLALA